MARSDSKQHRGLSQYGDDFSVPATDLDGHEIKTEGKLQEEELALVAIMHRLASLADPLLHDDDTSQSESYVICVRLYWSSMDVN